MWTSVPAYIGISQRCNKYITIHIHQHYHIAVAISIDIQNCDVIKIQSNYSVSQKIYTFKLSVPLSNLN